MKGWMAVILLGFVVLAESSDSAQRTFPNVCPCLISPCRVSVCPKFPRARCSPSYSCFPRPCMARWFVGFREVTHLCYS